MEYKTMFKFSGVDVTGAVIKEGSRFYRGHFKNEKEAGTRHLELFFYNEPDAENVTMTITKVE